jgi:uncharacterized protein (DUF433 family)
MTVATKAPSTFISFDDKGRAIITGTPYRVIQIAMDHRAYGWSPEEIRRQHYNEFSMAQVHAALSYYYEYQAKFDAEMDRGLREYEALRQEAGESPFVRRMRESGKLP